MANVNVNEAAEQFAKRLEKYPIEEQIAIGVISKNVMNGCSWEFVRRNNEVSKHLADFKRNPNVGLQDVTYSHDTGIPGYLVSMNFEYMVNLLRKEAPGLFSAEDLKHISEHRQNAIKGVATLMGKKFKGRIGVYCTNDGSTITIDGKTYPAFAITLIELLQICQRCKYGIVVDGITRDPTEVYKRASGVLKAATVAPSSNAILFDIAPM